jgi:hypothetical protein
MEVDGKCHAPATILPGERSGAQFVGGWVGLRAGLDGCENSRPHRNSIPRPSRTQRLAIATELSRPM